MPEQLPLFIPSVCSWRTQIGRRCSHWATHTAELAGQRARVVCDAHVTALRQAGWTVTPRAEDDV